MDGKENRLAGAEQPDGGDEIHAEIAKSPGCPAGLVLSILSEARKYSSQVFISDTRSKVFRHVQTKEEMLFQLN